MKKIFNICIILLCSNLLSNAQQGTVTAQVQKFNTKYFPASRITTLISCTPQLLAPICSYIQNNQFGTSQNVNAFGNGDVPFWSNSHGMPRLADPSLGIALPPGTSNFALMPYSNNGTQNLGSGIVQKIAPTVINRNYLLRFYEKNASFFFLNSLAKVEIYLIKCSDYQNFNVAGNTMPVVPTNSQRIFCETNYAASLQLMPWQNRTITFQANNNYDMIWIVATPTLTGLFPTSYYCFTDAELINVNNFSITAINGGTNPCTAVLNTNCTVSGSVLTWTGPNGQVFTGNVIIIDKNIPSNVGIWTVTLTTPNADSNNSTCGNNISITTSINITACGTTNVNCINLPLIQ